MKSWFQDKKLVSGRKIKLLDARLANVTFFNAPIIVVYKGFKSSPGSSLDDDNCLYQRKSGFPSPSLSSV
jgi:hypothetical protein